MPKMKTHKGAARRFKKTGTGKIRTRHSHAGHIKTKKSSKRKRNLRAGGIASAADTKRMRVLLP
ncbi:50S ribosomal protein L35 [Candidatus Fermentibacteria bacterium]|nr:MAG: 50S ribosomal protein L35 [Candidatus Fermentibacteria bacterium]